MAQAAGHLPVAAQPAVSPRSAGRLWTPSLGHVWLGLAVVAAALACAVDPIDPIDYWWSVRLGALIRQLGTLPTDDPLIYTASFLTNFGGGTAAGAEAALLEGFAAGTAYSNIHNEVFPGGEIRGQLAVIPEAGTWALMILGFGAVGMALRRRRFAFA